MLASLLLLLLLPLCLATPSRTAPNGGKTYWRDDDTGTSHSTFQSLWSKPEQMFTGVGTVYNQDNMAGSCGDWHDDEDFVCALGGVWMSYQNGGPECGRRIRVTNLGGDGYPVGGKGRSVVVVIKDSCETCEGDHVDLSVGAWDALTDESSRGQIRTAWHFMDGKPGKRHYFHDYDSDGDESDWSSVWDSGYDDTDSDDDYW
ncbi:RlpA-like double-psi beta-barrel-protein domain-containing protein-containing protein [Immersiella caudata]|uniref:RlpA-like double-psi beta-barrel-protein domain-containing protein-containing protein n=1 Tax=Immersiella caudata TaxID=314043 RepID=A0AA40CBS5_9PEZI|nr:RlpA-like double-psi beta-barrel-protein domain-containing protein-containing protein [Immersiella caudata]